MQLNNLPAGRRRLDVSIGVLNWLGADNRTWQFEIEITRIQVSDSADAQAVEFGLSNRFLSLLQDNVANLEVIPQTELTEEYIPELDIRIELTSFELPQNSRSTQLFIETWTILKVWKNGNHIENYTSPKIRDSGLIRKHPFERSLGKQLVELPRNVDFQEVLASIR